MIPFSSQTLGPEKDFISWSECYPNLNQESILFQGLTLAVFNILAQWHGLVPDEEGFVPLSIAEFSL